MGLGKYNDKENLITSQFNSLPSLARVIIIITIFIFVFGIGIIIGYFSKNIPSPICPAGTTEPTIQTTTNVIQSTTNQSTTIAPVVPSIPLFYLTNNTILDLLGCNNTPNHLKIDCCPDTKADKELCENRKCCWDPITYDEYFEGIKKPQPNVPYCYFPQNYTQYRFNGFSSETYRLQVDLYKPFETTFPPKQYPQLSLDVMADNKDRLRIRIRAFGENRYEVKYPKLEEVYEPTKGDRPYYVTITPNPFNIAVIRRDTNTTIFNTSIGPLIFADQFIQISTLLPSRYVYGLGETHDTFLHNIYWSRYTLFNHDSEPKDYINLYGSHPFYLNMEDSGKANGVLLFNSNAMDITLQPGPALTYQTIGGILDFFIFFGPGPDQVISQYTELIGRTFLPPYWSFGFHLCRYNYYGLQNTTMVMQRNVDAGIPFDTQWNDIDYMDNHKDFTYDKSYFRGLDQFVNKLHENGMHYMVIIDPGISSTETPGSYITYDEGLNQKVFVNDADGKPFEGAVWTDGNTVWVDFTHPNATGYWTTEFKRLYNEIKIDGAWIDMNEPSSFRNGTEMGCPNNTLDYPPFTPDVEHGRLWARTLCMSAVQYEGKHYDLHNLYGITQSIVTYDALVSMLKSSNRRPFIISRATFPGSGKYAGHWTGDISSNYREMKITIPGLLNFNIFGMPMIGADICGFHYNTTKEMCQRWMELGAFYPFARNHNDRDYLDQDPAAFDGAIIESSKIALYARYSLLPYLYSLFYRSHLYGETVVRALFFEFPNDKATYSIDEQFLWGGGLLISPVLTERTTLINAYFPKAIWYDFWTGTQILSTGILISLNTPMEKINLHVRGGYILPMQKPSRTTTESRKNSFWLLAALDENQKAEGQLFWDHGDQLDSVDKGEYNIITFHSEKNQLISQVHQNGYNTSMVLSNVTIFGVDKKPISVTINTGTVDFQYVASNLVLYITNLTISLTVPFNLSWNY